jgi:hypothetical protein
MGREEFISRLDRIDLTGKDYKDFIKPFFSSVNIENRVKYMKWLLEQNPANDKTKKLPIYIYRDKSGPIGQLGIIPINLKFGKDTTAGGWCIDFFIAQKGQRRGIGTKLIQAAHDDFPILLTLGQTDLAFNFFRKRGWHFSGRLTQYKKFLNYSYAIPKFIFKKIGFSFINKRKFKLNRSFQIFNQKYKCEEITTFSEYKLPKIDDYKSYYGIPRSRKFLKWRYFNTPFASYLIFRINISDYINIFFVLSISDIYLWTTAKLVDLLYPFDISLNELRSVMKIITSCASSIGAEVFECETSDSKVISALPKTVFAKKIPSSRFLYGSLNMDNCPLIPIDKWRLNSGDCDLEALAALYAEDDDL